MIPTWNNLPYLRKAVQSIRRHSEFDHEIVIHVNDGSDGTLDWVSRSGLSFTHSERNVGICRGINSVAKLCSRGVVAYFNDDMVALPLWDHYLVAYAETHALDRLMWLASTLVEPCGHNPDLIAPADYGTDIDHFDEDRLLGDLPTLRHARPDLHGSTWAPTVMYRDTLERIGGFSEEFSPGMGSDPDLAKKLWDLGGRSFVGVGRSLVYHFQCKGTSRMKKNNGHATFERIHGISIRHFIFNVLRGGATDAREPSARPSRLAKAIAGRVQIDLPVVNWIEVAAGKGKNHGFSWEQAGRRRMVLDASPLIERQSCSNDLIDSFRDAVAGQSGPTDLVSFIDVLQYLDKEVGMRLLQEALSAARAVLVFAPSGFLRQDYTTHPDLPEDWMIHRSGWSTQDFTMLGMSSRILLAYHTPRGHARPADAIVAWRPCRRPEQMAQAMSGKAQ